MNSIPMTADGLKQQYAHCEHVEGKCREVVNEMRRALSLASHERKKAYRRWQNKLKEAK